MTSDFWQRSLFPITESIQTLAPGLWVYLQWPIGITYLWWGIVWLLVARYYLRASLYQWKRIVPDYRGGSLKLLLGGFLFVAISPLHRLLQGKFHIPLEEHEHMYPKAMTLQLGIVASALASGMFGVAGIIIDRSNYTPFRLFVYTGVVMLSTLGGTIHLYPAMRNVQNIVWWRLMVLFTWLGIGSLYLTAVLLYHFGF